MGAAGQQALTADGAIAVRLRPSAAVHAALAALRGERALEVHAVATVWWLRGTGLATPLLQRLAALPDAELFAVDAAGLARPFGGRIPCAQVPRDAWRPLGAWLECELPQAAFVGAGPTPIALRLERCAEELPANALLTTLSAFAPVVLAAANVRLRPLRFALAADRRVLVLGTPLLPVPGAALVEAHGIALPAGHRFAPAVPLPLVARQLALQTGEVACFAADGAHTRVPAHAFVALTRSAVRLALRKVGPR